MTADDSNESMKEPTTPEEVLALHKILHADPQRYLAIVNNWITENPTNSHAYFERHLGWMKIGEPRRAIEDLNKALELDQEPVAFCSRGEVYRHLGEYEKALEDFHRGEAIDPAEWKDAAFGLLYQADCPCAIRSRSRGACLLCAAAGRLLDSGHRRRSGRQQGRDCGYIAPYCGRCPTQRTMIEANAGLLPIPPQSVHHSARWRAYALE